ncbi:MAG: iron-sulfur cluster assembly scaffold protein [Candidatus Thermoplasmatota archaeon]|nr:iron-sulfur cluster assembly scaffold protein [Candidatus Thermoplasmatota archaeon]
MTGSDLDGIVDDIEKRIRKDEERRFSEIVIREARNPQNMGRIEDPDRQAMIMGPCGDTMEFSLRTRDGRIEDIRFMTDGCGSSIACGSIATRMVLGKSLEYASDITARDILDELGGLPEENRHCAKLAADTLSKAIRNLTVKEP